MSTNYGWERILAGAVRSFQEKLCLILFTPFGDETREIAHNGVLGVDVPDLSFAREDIERAFAELRWAVLANIPTATQYGVEHVYCVWRSTAARSSAAV